LEKIISAAGFQPADCNLFNFRVLMPLTIRESETCDIYNAANFAQISASLVASKVKCCHAAVEKEASNLRSIALSLDRRRDGPRIAI